MMASADQGNQSEASPASAPNVRIYLTGFPEDLYTLALLFPEGRLSDLSVSTNIVGERDGIMHRVTDASSTETILTGTGCRRLAEIPRFDHARWIALDILSPLNGFATLADSNFVPVELDRATIEGQGRWGSLDLRPPTPRRRERLIAADRVQAQRDAMPQRVAFMTQDPLAAYAAAVIAGQPSWTDYYRVLEDIAGRCGTRIDRLHETGLASRRQQRAFTSAANNRLLGRHGLSGITYDGDQQELMTLLEAKEFVRRVVAGWLDQISGDRMPRDRVDGPALRFGLDDPL
jgi:hypothetical protein